jgi:hypothetical protein
MGEVEPVMSKPEEDPAAGDVIGSGEGFGAFVASRWPGLVRLAHGLAGSIRSRRAVIIGVAGLVGAVAVAALLVPGSLPAPGPAPPGQQLVITNTQAGAAGVVGPDGWMGPAGCRRGRGCPRGEPG